MPVTLEEVKQLIQEEFPGSDVDKVTEENHRVLGTIVWDQFQGMDSRERSRLITERVRDRLGLKGINIGILFPKAPGEPL